MTIDERLEFLFKSTESLHSSVQELHAVVQEHTQQVQEHTRQLEVDSENIRALARIAEIHERRLSDLEGNNGG
jgi:predicted DNA-binding ArsR family transcriptional regulator